MPRKRNKPNWLKIKNEYEISDISQRDLAKKYNISYNTLKDKFIRENWSKKNTKLHSKNTAITQQEIINESNNENTDYGCDELTEKQKLFCLYYIKDYNATNAYLKAFKTEYSTSQASGSRMLSNVNIKNEIKRLKSEMNKELFIEAFDVLNQYIKIAFADISNYLEWGQKEKHVMGQFGYLYDENKEPIMEMVNCVTLKDSISVDGSIIAELSQSKDGIKIKLGDKMKALEMLSKHFDLFPDNFKRKIEEEKLNIAKINTGLNNEKIDNEENIKSFVNVISKKLLEIEESEDEESEDEESEDEE